MAAPRLSPGYLHVEASPEHGEPVVYAPGQELPGWVQEAIDGGAALVADDIEGSFTLRLPAARRAASAGRKPRPRERTS
jgi:hypothetical protein